MPEEPHIYGHLTGAEYLEMVGQLRGIAEKLLARKIEGFLRQFSLYGDRYVQISSYSKGMRQKVLLAAALLHNPELILLDEPFSGLDVNSALVLRDLIRELAARGKTVLFSSHELDDCGARLLTRGDSAQRTRGRERPIAESRTHAPADARRNLPRTRSRAGHQHHHARTHRTHRILKCRHERSSQCFTAAF